MLYILFSGEESSVRKLSWCCCSGLHCDNCTIVTQPLSQTQTSTVPQPGPGWREQVMLIQTQGHGSSPSCCGETSSRRQSSVTSIVWWCIRRGMKLPGWYLCTYCDNESKLAHDAFFFSLDESHKKLDSKVFQVYLNYITRLTTRGFTEGVVNVVVSVANNESYGPVSKTRTGLPAHSQPSSSSTQKVRQWLFVLKLELEFMNGLITLK